MDIMGTGGAQGLALWALSPGLEFSARPHALLLGSCGPQYLLEAQSKGECIHGVHKDSWACSSCTSQPEPMLLHHGPGPGECLLGVHPSC